MKTIIDLAKGQKGKIVELTNLEISSKLMEMGFVPGRVVKLRSIAPLGDPYCFEVSGSRIALRKEDAQTVIVSPEKQTNQ